VRSESGARSVPFFFLVLVSALACSSSAPVTENDLPGLYVVRTGRVTDSLQLEATGQFQHRLWDDTGLAISETGNWVASHFPDGDKSVEFHGMSPFAARPAPHAPRPGWWLTRVGRDRNGRVTFLLNRDLNLVYTRTD